MQRVCIQGGLIVNSEKTFRGDVLLVSGRIARIDQHIPVDSKTRVISAEGLHVLPGIFDPQVHFRDPGLEHKEDLESGSKAAAAGGVTSFLEMPNTIPNTIDLESMADKKQRASEVCWVNYNFFVGATGDNIEEINSVPNVCGIKIFMGSSTGNLLVDNPEKLEAIFSSGSRLIAVHAEDEAMLNENKVKHHGTTDPNMHPVIRSTEAAMAATKLAVGLSKKYSRRLHILHLSTADEVEYLRTHKTPQISCELCPQHFLLHAESCYNELGTLAQMNPPIRTKDHGTGLWQGLKDGIIDCIATDHAPHTLEEKDQPYGKAPSGVPGVETSLPLMLNQVSKGNCTLNEVARWMAETPARLYKAMGKGRIQQGYDADIVLIDMEKVQNIDNSNLTCKAGWSPFHGTEVKGWPVMTIVHGEVVYDNGEFFKPAGREILIGN